LTKIIIPVENQTGPDSTVAEHFGRAPNYAIIELNQNKDIINVKTEANTNEHMGGTGHPHETLLTQKPDYLIVCGMGLGGLQSFKNAGVMVLKAQGATVKEVIANFKEGKLKELVGGCEHAHEHHH
jgi:predicted Fe-Mo cluster-binding NifX family protein